ncbi:MAG: sigma-70 family RNA polymerase sigma factor, partial [Verrucomicrobiota bacterium]
MSDTETDSDRQLLACYTRDCAEHAFAELVRRHVALVHSAALRQVRSPQLAEEVAQSVFTDLAHNAARLQPDTIVAAWLYQVTRRTAIDVVRRETRRQLREQIATEMNAMNATTADWTHIEPLLDDAMSALDETDRAAVLLRYFENKSLREVGAALGTSDDTAQKRVSRAVERLRAFFAKRGVTVGASGLAVALSANAVQAAPVGLALTMSTTAALAETTLTTAAIKTIAMTTLQKTLISVVIVAAVGTGIYEAHQAAS